MLSYPKTVRRFFQLERQSGNSLNKIIHKLYINHHILSTQQLDWLHFGFTTMAVGRENTAAALGAKMAVSFRGYDISRYPLKHSGVYHTVWQKVEKVHTISDALLYKGFKQGLSKNIKWEKITPAIDCSQFQHANAFNKKLNKNSPLEILTVARLIWVKGLEYTLHALALLYQQGIDFNYTIVGEGEEYERLVFAAHQLGIREKVQFAGKIPHEQIKRYYEQADIYLQYSIQEGFCNAVLEAQAMGLLCVVSDAEGLPENVLHAQTGWVVPKRQPQRLAQQLASILQLDADQLQQIRQHAVQRVQQEFNLEKQQRAFLQFYELD